MKKIFIIFGFFYFSNLANAETIVGTCYEPKGKRFDLEEGSFVEDFDGYSNSNPTFYFTSKNPEVLLENWQAANPYPDDISREQVDQLVPPKAIEAVIVLKSDQVIHAISQSGSEFFTTTLYLKEGKAVFGRVRVILPSGNIYPLGPMGALYTANCKFQQFQ